MSMMSCGSFGCSGEGWFDPWAYIQGLNDKNKSLGVQYTTGTVVAATRDPQSRNVLSVRIEDRATKEIYDVEVKAVVNAAGAAADQILNLLLGESGRNENGTSSPSSPICFLSVQENEVFTFSSVQRHQIKTMMKEGAATVTQSSQIWLP